MKRLFLFLPVLFFACQNEEEETPVELKSDQEIVSQYLDIDLDNTESYTDIEFPVHYTPPILNVTNDNPENPVTNEGAQLGRVLFYDVSLSLNNTISCASCHQQENGFSDLAQFSTGFENGLTPAHSMRLLNTKFYVDGSMFWDKRAESVEDQVVQPIQDHIEMGFNAENGGLDALLTKLRNLEYYPILFKTAFGSEEITEEKLAFALSQFVRSMVSVNSKFDEGFAQVFNPALPVRGVSLNFPNFNAAEFRGKDVFLEPAFAGAISCGGCHRPPTFALALEAKSNGLDQGETTVFKAPSLKSVALDGAFMHDGRFSTLEEVIEHYNSQVKAGPATDNGLIDPSTGLPQQLELSEQEKSNLVQYLLTLTDEDILEDEKFSNPFK